MSKGLAENIRAFRKERMMTQEDLAEALGVTVGAVYKWENGHSTPVVHLLVQIADLFGTSVDALLGHESITNDRESTVERLRSSVEDRGVTGALQEAEKALKKYPNNFETVYWSAQLFDARGTEDKNDAYLRRAMELYRYACLLIDQNKDDVSSVPFMQIRISEIRSKLSKTDKSGETATAHRYFGTDGFRGEAGRVLTAEHAYRVGRFLGWYYASPASGTVERNHRPRIVIGKDTRRSSYMLEYAIAAGITASGGDTYMLHVSTTPSVSYAARQEEFDCGVMISASHNSYEDNGIKLVNRYGEKMDDETTALIEMYLDGMCDQILSGAAGDLPQARGESVGAIIDHAAGRNRYMGYLLSVVSHSFRSLRIGLDLAGGATWMLAPAIFEALGATTYVIGGQPNGTNINRNCGSTHTEALRELVLRERLDVGFAFDGDGDRCIAVDENGNEIDGDRILYVLAGMLKRKDALTHDTVVTTVMSNGGLKKALKEMGIRTVETAVGDRYVYEAMAKGGYMLGGEQSGHVILQKYATTGDGILTALMLTEEMLARKSTLGKLTAPVRSFPQITRNVRVKDRKEAMSDKAIHALAKKLEERLGQSGRILLRESGTEPVIRIMVEAEDQSLCHECVEEMEALFQERYGG